MTIPFSSQLVAWGRELEPVCRFIGGIDQDGACYTLRTRKSSEFIDQVISELGGGPRGAERLIELTRLHGFTIEPRCGNANIHAIFKEMGITTL